MSLENDIGDAKDNQLNLSVLLYLSGSAGPPAAPQDFSYGISSISTWDSLRCFQLRLLPRKEVIQPHLPIRLPCYDFTPVIGLTFDGWLLSVASPASGATNSHGVTGGVYKARERIHRGMLIRDY